MHVDDRPCLHCRTPIPAGRGYEIKHPQTLETHDVLCDRCGPAALWLLTANQASAIAGGEERN